MNHKRSKLRFTLDVDSIKKKEGLFGIKKKRFSFEKFPKLFILIFSCIEAHYLILIDFKIAYTAN